MDDRHGRQSMEKLKRIVYDLGNRLSSEERGAVAWAIVEVDILRREVAYLRSNRDLDRSEVERLKRVVDAYVLIYGGVGARGEERSHGAE